MTPSPHFSMSSAGLNPAMSRRRFGGLVLAGAASLLPAACSSNSGGTSGGGGGSTGGRATTVKVGVIPIVDVVPIYLGIKQGFFSEQGLNVSLESEEGGASIIPAVVSGQYHIGFSNTISVLLASTQGVPLKVLSAGVASTGQTGKDFGAVIVKSGSPIKSAVDLVGKRVAVNTLKNINTTTVNYVVKQAGGDPSTIQYVELAFPDIMSAVAKGDVDAGQVVEPFLTIATGQGDIQVVSNYAGTNPNLTVGMYFTSQAYLAQSEKAARGFTTGMTKSLEYASAHPDEARAILTTYTEIDPTVQQNLTLPKWPSTISRESVEQLATLAQQDGLISKQPDLAALLPS